MKKTKNIVLIISLIFTALLFKADVMSNYCYIQRNCGFLLSIIDSSIFVVLLLFSLPIFFFSLITYFMKEEIFRSWIIFACIGLLLSIIFVLITPYTGGGFGLGISGVGSSMLFTLPIFFLISLIIIIVRLIQTRKK